MVTTKFLVLTTGKSPTNRYILAKGANFRIFPLFNSSLLPVMWYPAVVTRLRAGGVITFRTARGRTTIRIKQIKVI